MDTTFQSYPLSEPVVVPSPGMVRKVIPMIALYVLLTLVTFTVARAASGVWLPSCSGGEAMLEFPVYNARGLVIDTETHCGKARSVCTLKMQTPKGPVVYVSGFVEAAMSAAATIMVRQAHHRLHRRCS